MDTLKRFDVYRYNLEQALIRSNLTRTEVAPYLLYPNVYAVFVHQG